MIGPIVLALCGLCAVGEPVTTCSSIVHPAVTARFDAGAETVTAWVFFRDKGVKPDKLDAALRALETTYDGRALARRRLRRTDPGLLDERDLPIDREYHDLVAAAGAHVRVESAWANALSVRVTRTQAQSIAQLACVRAIEPVRSGRRPAPLSVQPVGGYTARDFYGRSLAQLDQINLPTLHALGFTGQGVVVGVLDTGFRRDHDAFNQPGHVVQVIAEHDFINNDANAGFDPGDPDGQYVHGTLILGCIGAYKPDDLVGGAYNAAFILCKTEDISSETPIEEDYYVAGLQFIESHGGDVATSSLGYIDWYTQADLNGATAVTTIAVNTATANGVHCCTAAGNAGHDDDPATSHLIAPADALRVFTCGAGRADGTTSGFSSDGPTADGRLKPEVLARGSGTSTVNPDNPAEYAQASGTSLSTPLVAAAIACLTQARPGWTVDQMRAAVFATASDQAANGVPDPLFIRGYGFINAAAAFGTGCDPDYNQDGNRDQDDVFALIQDIAAGTTTFPPNSPDFNADGNSDQDDVAALITVVAGGYCP